MKGSEGATHTKQSLSESGNSSWAAKVVPLNRKVTRLCHTPLLASDWSSFGYANWSRRFHSAIRASETEYPHPTLRRTPHLYNGCSPGYRICSGQHRLHKVRHLTFLIVFIHLLSHYHRYWGKRDTKLILPTNSSLSVTLDQDHLRSTTTSRADPSFDKDRLWLNGKEESIEAGGRLATCIAEMKRLRAAVEAQNSAAPKVPTSFHFRFPSHPLTRPPFRPAAVHLPGVHCFP